MLKATGSSKDSSINSNKKTAIDDTKKILDNFREGLAKYPIYISDKGAITLNVQFGIGKMCRMDSLSDSDQLLILAQADKNKLSSGLNKTEFAVSQDSSRDFILTFGGAIDMGTENINVFNSILHPKNDYIDTKAGIPVKIHGGVIEIVDTEKLKQIANIKSSIGSVESENMVTQRRPPVSGRNGFEIRSDVMGMAVDYCIYNKTMDPKRVVDIARLFYDFVENKNRHR